MVAGYPAVLNQQPRMPWQVHSSFKQREHLWPSLHGGLKPILSEGGTRGAAQHVLAGCVRQPLTCHATPRHLRTRLDAPFACCAVLCCALGRPPPPLQASDAELKAALGMLVDMAVWSDAGAVLEPRRKAAKDEISSQAATAKVGGRALTGHAVITNMPWCIVVVDSASIHACRPTGTWQLGLLLNTLDRIWPRGRRQLP